MPEYKFEETKLTCPKCEKGKVRLVISKKEGKEYKFFRCSEYDCDWNGGFYNQDSNMMDMIENCPSCDGILYVRNGKNGPFLGCSHFPDCKHTRKLTEEEIKLIESRSDDNLDKFISEGRDSQENETAQKEESDDEKNEKPTYERIETPLKCPECEKGNVVLVIKTTGDKETKFFRCSEDDCHWNGGFYNRDEIKTDVLEHCPSCNGIVYEKIGRKGPFMACSNFPKCKYTRNIEKLSEDADLESIGEDTYLQSFGEDADLEIIEEDTETQEHNIDETREDASAEMEIIDSPEEYASSPKEVETQEGYSYTNEAQEDSLNYDDVETQTDSPNNDDIETQEEETSSENIQESEEETENEESQEDKPKASYERFETKLLCPECMEGQVILIRNMDTGKGFFRCTNNDCDWDGGPYSQPLVQLKHVTYCQEKGCKGINYHTEGKFGPYKACTWFSKTGCRPKKKR